MIAWSCS